MIKNLSSIEVQVGEKIYRFICDIDGPIEHCEQALVYFMQIVGKVKENLQAQQAPQDAPAEPAQEQQPAPAEEPKAE